MVVREFEGRPFRTVPESVSLLTRRQPHILDLAAVARPIKQVIVARDDLKIRTGKLAAQAAHAAIDSMLAAFDANAGMVVSWKEDHEQLKVVLRITGEDALLTLFARVQDAGIPTSLIRDAGRTQVTPNTPTAVGIGPWFSEEINVFTSELRLL